MRVRVRVRVKISVSVSVRVSEGGDATGHSGERRNVQSREGALRTCVEVTGNQRVCEEYRQMKHETERSRDAFERHRTCFDTPSGMGGGAESRAIWNMTVMRLSYWLYGGRAVSISTTVQPTLHTSAFFQFAVWLSRMTSGAM